jgi:hypothetical protein
MADSAFISGCMRKVLGGGSITFEEAERLLATDDVACRLRQHYNPDI